MTYDITVTHIKVVVILYHSNACSDVMYNSTRGIAFRSYVRVNTSNIPFLTKTLLVTSRLGSYGHIYTHSVFFFINQTRCTLDRPSPW